MCEARGEKTRKPENRRFSVCNVLSRRSVSRQNRNLINKVQPCGLSFCLATEKPESRENEIVDYREPDKNIVLLNKVFIKMSADDRRGQQVAHRVSSIR